MRQHKIARLVIGIGLAIGSDMQLSKVILPEEISIHGFNLHDDFFSHWHVKKGATGQALTDACGRLLCGLLQYGEHYRYECKGFFTDREQQEAAYDALIEYGFATEQNTIQLTTKGTKIAIKLWLQRGHGERYNDSCGNLTLICKVEEVRKTWNARRLHVLCACGMHEQIYLANWDGNVFACEACMNGLLEIRPEPVGVSRHGHDLEYYLIHYTDRHGKQQISTVWHEEQALNLLERKFGAKWSRESTHLPKPLPVAEKISKVISDSYADDDKIRRAIEKKVQELQREHTILNLNADNAIRSLLLKGIQADATHKRTKVSKKSTKKITKIKQQ